MKIVNRHVQLPETDVEPSNTTGDIHLAAGSAKASVSRIVAAVVLAALSFACTDGARETPPAGRSAPGAGEREVPSPLPEVIVELAAPAAAGSRTPSLFAAADGRVYMSWLEPVETDDAATASTQRGRFALRFATLDADGSAWSAARTIAEGDDFFVNWADFPTIVESNGMLAAHWLRMNGGRGTAYDIQVAHSSDGGETWSDPVVPHTDGTRTEHGFVSLVPEPGGGFTAVWLDGRKYATAEDEAGREMTLRTATFGADGTPGAETLLDARICDCCQTSAAMVGDTLVAVYRDRSDEEIRDIWSVRRTADGWQEPVAVAADGWQIPGCPVNGPAIAANGDTAIIAWFTMRDGNPEVRAAFTHDAGASFTEPTLLDRAGATGVDASSPRQVSGLADASDTDRPIPLGRVDVAWTGPTRAVVTWIVARGSDARLVMRGVHLDGRLDDVQELANTGSLRASGFPRIVRQGDRLVLAWTVPAAERQSLHTGVVSLAPSR